MFINGRPHQWARLQAAAGWASADLSSLKYIPRGDMIREHPTVTTDWDVPMAFGTTETMTVCTGFTAGTPAESWICSVIMEKKNKKSYLLQVIMEWFSSL